jgi:hypothetical protein
MNLNDQLALKLKLERIFNREVRSLFNRIRVGYRIGVSTGNTVRAQAYAPAWQALLEKHYARTQRAFNGIVKEDTKQEDERNDEVLAALMAWNLTSAQTVTREIINTTQNNMDTSLSQARQALSDEGNFQYSQRELALVSAVILDRKFKGRETTIVVTNTQQAAESTKLIGAYGEAGLDPMAAVTRERVVAVGATLLAKKNWFDVGDKDVRRGHHASEVAQVQIWEPFTVNGEKLMYPGDSSLGASAVNVINCRCSSLYTFN